MKTKTGILLLGATALIGAAPATAGQDGRGWYSSLQAGANWLEDENIKGAGTICGGGFCVWGDANPYGGIEFSTGYAVAGAIGYGWASNWNVEFELAYRENDIECLTGAATTCTNYKTLYPDPGNIWQLSQFVNMRYDIPVTHHMYVGVGAGLGGTLISAEDERGLHADDYVLSGQLIGQVGYNFAKRWDVFLDYRYMITDEPDFANLTYISGKLDTSTYDVRNHSVMLGLRLGLQEDCEATPPPPPPKPPTPVPPPAPREFIVFFGFNKSNLTADAQKVVAEAAAAAAQYNAEQVIVIGHADTVGSPRYNMELSERRAESVRAELVRMGVPAERIATSGRGESDPMVQTGDGVREPQNRRASITIVIQAATN
jgi:outer membrane protein OmpA-like peptidoglycan-associated protein